MRKNWSYILKVNEKEYFKRSVFSCQPSYKWKALSTWSAYVIGSLLLHYMWNVKITQTGEWKTRTPWLGEWPQKEKEKKEKKPKQKKNWEKNWFPVELDVLPVVARCTAYCFLEKKK